MAAQMIRKNNVKVIQVVRDPRGMSSSRARFQIYKKYKNTPSRDEMLDKLDDIVRNYCAWMETNYVSVMHGPEWLRNNYKIVRFEDLVARPAESAAALYKFVGLPITDKVRQKIRTLEEEKPMDAEAWRFKTGMELARRAQEMCSPTVYDMFGYRMINRGGILMNKNFSLVGDLPRSSMFLLDNI
uniref:Carbohydrate sulfotransferase 3-like n=1 Tax=Saccoglossus kowalevskii TaxID=10224 RepID=A0ABM0MTY4_SACKO|nr:PREDICTED: carbohydrate sulfotransferase 3-like [Saccoglossus kowalevskii]